MVSQNAPGGDERVAMFERMLLIRRVEQQLGEDSRAGRLPGNVHLCSRQATVGAGVAIVDYEEMR